MASDPPLATNIEGPPVLAKPELGEKQICPNCGAKFYDLTKRPAHCPKCATEFDPEEVVKTRRSRPRRGRMDADDRLWFAEWRADKIAMFDTRTEKFQEWPVPTPWTAPYDVVPDRNGELWSAGMNTDRVLRFDPKTGKSVEYLLPRETNIRRVFVDNRTTPVTFWVGNNHGASIVKVEALE